MAMHCLRPSIHEPLQPGALSIDTAVRVADTFLINAMQWVQDAVNITDLIDRYCGVWTQPDPNRRAALLASVWAEHASYTDPSVHAANAVELLSHIAKVQAQRPGAKVLRTSAVDVHHAVARFMWHVVEADGRALPDGMDIAFLTPDGSKIARIIGFFGPLSLRMS